MGEDDEEPGFDRAPDALAVVERAMEIVNADLRASGLPGAARLVLNECGGARVHSWDGTGGGGFGVSPADGRDPVTALVAVADDTQDAVLETIWSVWPVCPRHQVGVHAQRRDDRAVWWCKGGGAVSGGADSGGADSGGAFSGGGHALAPVGQLGSGSARRGRARKRDRSG